MTLSFRLIAHLLLALLLTVAAPFSMGGERVAEPWTQESVTAMAGAEAPPADVGTGADDRHGAALDNAGGGEPLELDIDAQECALPSRMATVHTEGVTAPIAFLSPRVPSPALAALDRPPRGR